MKSQPLMICLCVALTLALSAGCEEKKADAPTPLKTTPAVEQAEPTADKPAGEAGDTGAAAAKGGSVTEAEEGGQWVTSNPYKVKFRVPEDWNIKIEDDGVSATDSDDTTTVVLIGSQSQGTIQAAVADIQKKVKIKDAKLQETTDVVINGMPGQSVTGTAVLSREEGDQEIQFIAYNVRVAATTVVTMMIFSEAEMYEAKKEIIDGLAQTITKS